MKKIKLRKVNSRKYCKNCNKITKIKMNGLDGFCIKCLEKDVKIKLYTLNPNIRNIEK